MLLDESAFVASPRGRSRRDSVGKKTVDPAGEKIVQVLRIVGGSHDDVGVARIRDEGIDPVVGVDEPRDHTQSEFLLCEGVEHLLDRPKWIAGTRSRRQDQNIGLAAIRLGKVSEGGALVVVGCARGDVRTPCRKAARCSCHARSGSSNSTPMMRARARSISTSKPVRVGTPWR